MILIDETKLGQVARPTRVVMSHDVIITRVEWIGETKMEVHYTLRAEYVGGLPMDRNFPLSSGSVRVPLSSPVRNGPKLAERRADVARMWGLNATVASGYERRWVEVSGSANEMGECTLRDELVAEAQRRMEMAVADFNRKNAGGRLERAAEDGAASLYDKEAFAAERAEVEEAEALAAAARKVVERARAKLNATAARELLEYAEQERIPVTDETRTRLLAGREVFKIFGR